MKQVMTVVTSWCDYPGCADEAAKAGETTQETISVQFLFYTSGRGRKTNPINVEMCKDHADAMRLLYQSMQKYDQKND
jgi:hypothetical protein